MKIGNIRAESFCIAFLLLFEWGCGNTNLGSSENLSSDNPTQKTTEQDSTANLISEEVSSTIAKTLESECNRLLESRLTEKECQSGMQILAKELDFRIAINASKQTAFTFFATSLENILANKESLVFIENLQNKIYNLLFDGQGFNLWDFALAESNQNETLALERITVLLQDGSENATQVKYLLIKKHPMAFKLEELLRTLTFAQKSGKLAEYPQDFASPRHTIYHYYVPRLLAVRLKGKNFSGNLSRVLPFLFNSAYELRQIHGEKLTKNTVDITKQAKYYSEGNPNLENLFVKWQTFDAQYIDLIDHLTGVFLPFDASLNSENLEDIYLGYLGSSHGSLPQGSKSCNVSSSNCLTRTYFSDAFSKNPAGFLKSMIR